MKNDLKRHRLLKYLFIEKESLLANIPDNAKGGGANDSYLIYAELTTKKEIAINKNNGIISITDNGVASLSNKYYFKRYFELLKQAAVFVIPLAISGASLYISISNQSSSINDDITQQKEIDKIRLEVEELSNIIGHKKSTTDSLTISK